MPEFQLNVLRHLLFLIVIIAGIFYGATALFIQHWIDKGVEAGLTEDNIFFSFMSQLSSSLFFVFIVTAVLVGLVVIVLGLLLSHKVAGPIYNLKRYLESVKENGWKEPLQFRKGDHFQEIAQTMNELYRQQKENSRN